MNVKTNDWFTCTSAEPYDRHHYRLNFSDGSHRIFESWDQVQAEWFQRLPTSLSHIDVLDIKQNKKTTSGGFK
jgi:hypothetical protein